MFTFFEKVEAKYEKLFFDHSIKDINNETIDLFVRKFPSIKERQGSIWLISGGPGESGASLYPLIAQFSRLFPHLDILVPDHRGTGLSSKVCPKEEAVDSPNGISLANNEWGACFNHMYSNQTYVQAFSITNAAKDLNLLINNFNGEGKCYIWCILRNTIGIASTSIKFNKIRWCNIRFTCSITR